MGYAHSIPTTVDDDGRQVPRTNLFLSAVARWDKTSAPVRLRDLSATGARLEGAMLPDFGKSVSLSRGELCCVGRVVWRDQGRCGVRFHDPLHLRMWIPNFNEVEQQTAQVAARIRAAEANRGAPIAAAPAKAQAESLPVRIAEEIACAARLLEGISDGLVADPVVVARHSQHIKDLGVSTRVLAHVALILASAEPNQATSEIDMDELRRRLKRGSL